MKKTLNYFFYLFVCFGYTSGAFQYSSSDGDYEYQYYHSHPDQYQNYLTDYELAPENAASLVIVFDVTGSMNDDLEQVIDGAAKVLASAQSRNDRPIHNFILVPLHDPDVGPATITTDPLEFQESLKALHVQGGGDCPEMSISAIKMALEVSLPHSYIYVFTDARAKDYDVVDEVLTLVQEKQSEVVFIMTGDCGEKEHVGYTVYRQIASTSSGQLFELNKEQVKQVLNFVIEAVKSRKVNLISTDKPPLHQRQSIDLLIDSSVQEFTISVSGNSPKIAVFNPEGVQVDESSGLSTLLNIMDSHIVNVRNPKPGKWTFHTNAEHIDILRVTGLSSLDFSHGFSATPLDHISTSFARPIKGLRSHLLINNTDLQPSSRILSIRLLNVQGNTLLDFPAIRHHSNPHLFTAPAFLPPDEYFYIQVEGVDDKGYKFQRLTPTALKPAIATPPIIFLPEITKGVRGSPSNLTCEVFSQVPFEVQWLKDNVPLAPPTRVEGTQASVHWSVLDSPGRYVCNASNFAGWNASDTHLHLQDPIPVIEKPTVVEASLGNNALLQCITNVPKVKITWYKVDAAKGRRIMIQKKSFPNIILNNNGSLTIKKVSHRDEGAYVCKALNQGGYSEARVPLTIKKAPKLSISTDKKTFKNGSFLQLDCNFPDKSANDFKWIRNGQTIKGNERGRLIQEHGKKLLLTKMTRNDEGKWGCSVNTRSGPLFSSLNLTYIEKPRIVAVETEVMVPLEDTATLHCQVTGVPAPKVTWSKNHVQLQEMLFMRMSKEGHLWIDGVQLEDAGVYTCEASNQAGSVQETVKLNVGWPPIITTQLSNHRVEINTNATLPCQAEGNPQPQIVWSKDFGEEIIFEKNKRLRVLKNGDLFIQPFQKEDEGMYQCKAVNTYGHDEASAFVEVSGIVDPVVAPLRPGATALKGGDLKLECKVLQGNPPPVVTWFKMGKPLAGKKFEGAKVSANETGGVGVWSMWIRDVAEEDKGEYTCVAHNIAGNVSQSTQLDVHTPPKLEEAPKEVTGQEGASVKLPCEVSGNPKPRVEWSVQGNKIYENDPRYLINEKGVLSIFAVKKTDAGSYECSASNAVGKASHLISLTVETPPVITGGPSKVSTTMGNSIFLPCQASGHPPPTYTWFRRNQELSDSNNTQVLPDGTLKIVNVSSSHQGMYGCRVRNRAGMAEKLLELHVQVPPKLLQEGPEEVKATKGDRVVLDCRVAGMPKPVVTWKKLPNPHIKALNPPSPDQSDGSDADGVEVRSEPDGSLLIVEATPSDSGIYTCFAENSAGSLKQTTLFTVHEPPTFLNNEKEENDFEVIEGHSVVLPCEVSGFPVPVVTWLKDGSEVGIGGDSGFQILPEGSLEVSNAREEHEGGYVCQALNEAGSRRKQVSLSVFMLPRFKNEIVYKDGSEDDSSGEVPKEVAPTEVMLNSTVHLDCHVYSNPPSEITWYKNGEEIKAADVDEGGRVRILEGGKELVVTVGGNEDTARYTCVARNVVGEVEKHYDLQVLVRPFFTDEDEVMEVSGVSEGSSIFKCPVSGSPTPAIEWFKDGVVLKEGANVRMLYDGQVIELLNVSRKDEGSFSCVATNSAGKITRTFVLDVSVPAHINLANRTTAVETTLGGGTQLHCPVTGTPEPTIQWSWNGKSLDAWKLRSSVEVLQGNTTLRISKSGMEHAGRYACEATNKAGGDEKYFDLEIIERPKISTENVEFSLAVVANKSVVMDCVASGTPYPEIFWVKDKVALTGASHRNVQILSGGMQLRILNAVLSDTGIYSCVAVNKAGSDDVQFALSVQIPASIDKSRLNVKPSSMLGETINFDCPVLGVPTPTIAWFKDNRPIYTNGQPLPQSSNMRVLNDGRRLELVSEGVEDAGVYVCKAHNEAGQDSVEHDFKIFVPPEIVTASKRHKQVIVDETTSLVCVASGVEEPEIQWLQNGRPLGSSGTKYRLLDDNSKLELIHAQIEDAGRYTCIAKNQAGVADQDFEVSVLVPPVIDESQYERSLKLVKGKTIQLTCPARGLPFPRITWFKDNHPFLLSNRSRLLLSGRVLEISQAHTDDSGAYSCTAKNPAGSVSLDYQLSVHIPPRIDESNLVSNPRIAVNRSITLECPSHGSPPPEVLWLKGDYPVETFFNTSKAAFLPTPHGTTLELRNVQLEESGVYTCVVKNDAGEVAKSFELEVLVPPSLREGTKSEEVDVREGGVSMLSCHHDGHPSPNIAWFKGDTPLESLLSHFQTINGGKQLKLRNLKEKDAGVYTCKVSNAVGEVHKSYKLNVLRAPRIMSERLETDLKVLDGSAMVLKCRTTGLPEPEVTWFKDGRELQKDADRVVLIDGELELASVAQADAGAYVCEATNKAGKSQKVFHVSVQVAPSIEDSEETEKITVLLGDIAQLKCPAQASPEPLIQWKRQHDPHPITFHYNIRVINAGKVLEIFNTQLTDTGGYTCVAENVAGSASKRFQVEVHVPPSIEGDVEKVVGVQDQRVSIPCEFSGVPTPQVTWVKNGANGALRPGVLKKRSGSLQLSKLQLEDRGVYRCTANNSVGVAYRDVLLEVQVPPKLLQTPKLTIKAKAGTATDLPCVVEGDPDPLVSWNKGSRLLIDRMGYGKMNDNSLRIEGVEVADAGPYICHAQNSAGSVMAQITLEVDVPARISPPIERVFEVLEQRDVTIPCPSTGFPPPTITWTRNQKALDPATDNYRILPSGGLSVHQAKPANSGTFSCTAANSAGSDSYDVQLVVQVLPKIEPSKRKLTVIEGTKVELPCSVQGIPAPSVRWLHNGIAMTISHHGNNHASHHQVLNYYPYVIENVKASDRGLYVCVARNVAGKSSKEVVLDVQVPPTIVMGMEDTEVLEGGRVELECQARGRPPPAISWLVNGSAFHDARLESRIRISELAPGKGRLTIGQAHKNDQGTYTCEAANDAGSDKMHAMVFVKVPPKVLMQRSIREINVTSTVMLDCPLEHRSSASFVWTKNFNPVLPGGRIFVLPFNGSLVIYNLQADDAGEYKCTASNEVGSSEGMVSLQVKEPPTFAVSPADRAVTQGDTVTLDCVVHGGPKPQRHWRRQGAEVRIGERFYVFPNNSLRIIAVQSADSGSYECVAENSMGTKKASMQLTVRVDGQFGVWSAWTMCSSTCDQGVQKRHRKCDQPSPANGGRPCEGSTEENMMCLLEFCPVDGDWGQWSGLTSCSSTCGQGSRRRSRKCDSPPPRFGGASCEGEAFEENVCNSKPCPVNGDWGNWSPWTQCSERCGDGVRRRSRFCNHPPPSHGGLKCKGISHESSPCFLKHCEIDGNWGGWALWSGCSLSCGGGTRLRKRTCDSPVPSEGGQHCLGSDFQSDYCNKDECPVHGGWAVWSAWGECTVRCGGGKQKRFRTCTHPPPSHSGRPCIGESQQSTECNSHGCAVDGSWAEWGGWSECSVSCGGGLRERVRECHKPLHGGFSCHGDSFQAKKCNQAPCKAIQMRSARGNLEGEVDGVAFSSGLILSNVTRTSSGTVINASVSNVSLSFKSRLRPMVSILMPVYWASATEVASAVNGFSLTAGSFVANSQVELANGDIVEFDFSSYGVDAEGVLEYDVYVYGNLTDIGVSDEVLVSPFVDHLIKTEPGTIHAFSSRLYQVNNHSHPHAWKHSITYEDEFKSMPHLAQTSLIDTISIDWRPDLDTLAYNLTAYVTKGEPNNQCPTGFELDTEGLFCKDKDECEQMLPCSHSCSNNVGGFTCDCPAGFLLDSTGRVCLDIDECEVGMATCEDNSTCVNVPGSYKCLDKCQEGYRLSLVTWKCEDEDECKGSPCDQLCTNLPGAFACSCRQGFDLNNDTKCEDIDECLTDTHQCSHNCENIVGSYKCLCPAGYFKSSKFNCTDLDECEEGTATCAADQMCQNTPGGFSCVNTCSAGTEMTLNNTCIDIDECLEDVCEESEVCVNTVGSFKCMCEEGYQLDYEEDICVDVDECAQKIDGCSHSCVNSQGSFKCACPTGRVLAADDRTCVDPKEKEVLTLVNKLVANEDCGSRRPCSFPPCPKGFALKNGLCKDIDECERKSPCQHSCKNTLGGYQCLCPPGYRLQANKRSCMDVDECEEGSTDCGDDQRCFNKRGGFECINVSCPLFYEKDPLTGDCVLDCSKAGANCSEGLREQLVHHVVSLPSGISANKDLVRLSAYDYKKVFLPLTSFEVLNQQEDLDIRLEEGRGLLYTLHPLEDDSLYKVLVEATSIDHRDESITYSTTFEVYVAIAKYPY